ncbi:MAG: 16S rRNA (guanine(527)-N(7))-methyltransferase RsmG [Propionibacteriaceae bacterium]|nr:16S rRNA (guanine(527)-N(7))-methyltransferase RsmG [Propionibacteriaceae bacterium]
MIGEELVQQGFPESYKKLKQYVDILASRGIEWGLLGPREAERLWERHILNSLALVELIPEGLNLVDVGSGAGLPGLPLAIVRPDLTVTLMEPLLRRSDFLSQAVEELGCQDQVRVVRVRAEDSKETFKAVTCRAVAPLDKLLRWCTPLIALGGALYALKGSSAADEVAAARKQLTKARLRAEVRSARAHVKAEATNVILVRRAA